VKDHRKGNKTCFHW